MKAKYTYGKPVKGEAKIIVGSSKDQYRSIYVKEVSKLIPIDGKATVDFDLHDELDLNSKYDVPISIEASFTEELTGHVQKATSELDIFKNRAKLEIVKITEKLKPGLPFSFLVKVLYQDNTPVIDENNLVEIKIDCKNNETIQFYKIENGLVQVNTEISGDAGKLPMKVLITLWY